MAVDSFGGIILDDAPAQTRQPQRDQFGGIILGDSPQAEDAGAGLHSAVGQMIEQNTNPQEYNQLAHGAIQHIESGTTLVKTVNPDGTATYTPTQTQTPTRLSTPEKANIIQGYRDRFTTPTPPAESLPEQLIREQTQQQSPVRNLANSALNEVLQLGPRAVSATEPMQGDGVTAKIHNAALQYFMPGMEGPAGQQLRDQMKTGREAIAGALPANPDSKATTAGQIIGGTVPYLMGPGGLAVGAAASEGDFREQVRNARAQGATISPEQEALGAAIIVVNTMAAGKMVPRNTLIPAVQQSVLKYMVASGYSAADMAVLQAVDNAVKKATVNPEQDVTEGLGSAAAMGAGAHAVTGLPDLMHKGGNADQGPHGQPQRMAVGDANVPPAGPDNLTASAVQKPVPVPSAETLKTLTTAPEPKAGLTDKTTPKYRVQDGAESKGVPIEFESRDDKLHYLATQPRVGKVGKQAIQELKDRGFSDDQIDSYGAELRDRVSKLAKGSAGDSIRVPAVTPAEAPVARNNPAVQGGESKLPVGDVLPAEVKNATVESPVVQPASPEAVAQTVAGRSASPETGRLPVQNGAENIQGDIPRAVSSGPDVARAESELSQIRPQARVVKPSKYVAAASKAVEGVLGVKVVHINDEGGAAGFTNPAHKGIVFIDARRPVKGWAEVLAHEWMHTVQDSDKATAKAFYDAIPDAQKAKYLADYKSKLVNLKGIDTAQYLTPEVTEREIGAMALQDAATRSSVRRQLLGQKAGVWEKIVETGQGLWDKLTGKHQIVDKAIDLIREKAIKPEEANVKNPVPVAEVSGAGPSGGVEGVQGGNGGHELRNPQPAEGPVRLGGPKVRRRVREADPQGTLFAPKGSERVQQEAEEYTKSAGVPYVRRSEYAEVNVERAKRIAAEYDLSTHSPQDPKVKASYEAFKKETLDQWKYLESKGVKFEAWDKDGQPYKNSEEMRADVSNNKHLYFFQGGDLPADHPLAANAPGTPYSYNDVFRAVHDYFGHTKEGVGFGPRGEENAWRSHSAMYSEGARGAMTTETRGQNSWVNFGPHGEHNQANPAATKYAEQKATLLPPEYSKVDETSFSPKSKEEKELYKHLTEEERSSLTAPEAKRALDVFRSLPPDEEFAAAAKAGLAKKGWYEKAGAALIDLFGPDTRRFTALLAADSPRQTVEKNLAESLRIWHAWDKAGRPTDEAQISALLGDVMETRRPNILRALKGANELSGYKVSNFKENLLGNLQAVTNDAWMAKFGDLEQKVFADNGGYLGYTAKIRRVAKKIGLEPAQVQETIWSFFKTLSERINRDTTGHEALSNLKHEDVAAAPAFADMLGDENVRTALKQLGLTEQSIRRAEGSAEAAGPGEEPPAGYVAEGRKSVLNRIAQRAEKYAKNQPSEMSKSQRTLFYPGEKFVEEDLKPASEKIGKMVADAWTGVKSLVAPHARSGEGRYAADVLRERGAELAQRYDRLNEAFHETRNYFDKLDQPTTRDFIDSMEKGLRQTDPALQPVADSLRSILNDRLTQIQALGTGKLATFIQNYFPHLWKDPKAASKVYSDVAKAPLEGRKGFLKRRSLRLFSDGLAKGLEPVTENPVEAVMLRVREMDKYITIHQAFQEMGMKGVLRRIKARDSVPVGYAKINDNIATVYAKPSRRGAVQIGGYIVAPEAVANVINNYLSPGIRGNKNFGGLFRAYLGVGNVMNQVQLGLSGFHLLNTTLDSSISKLALALKQGASGQKMEAAKSLASAATIIGPAIGNFHKGNLVMREWLKPGSTTPEVAAVVDAMKAAGGRIKMDEFYQTGMTAKMMDAWKRGNVLGAVLRSPFAAIEQSAKPIMEKIVPRMKMGVFHDMARYELSKLDPSAGREEMRAAMRKAWDSVDNRMGELVYDNLFWNKAVKDLAMASTRSVGWNLGTLRELAGGVVDLGVAAKHIATGNPGKAEFTHRMAYATAMPFMAGLIGGMIHYALGNGVPKEQKDWFFPKTGEKDKEGHDIRLALPSYIKDVLSYGKDPGKTLSNKIHPMLNTIMEMLQNKDYYGTKIRNEDDPFLKQLKDEAIFVGEQFTPFGVREVKKLHEEGQGARSLLPLVGIVQARNDITHSAAELKAQELMQERRPPGTRTQEEADKSKRVRDLSNSLKAREPGARDAIRDAAKSGELTAADIQNIRNRQKFSGLLERSLKGMEPADAMKVWEVMEDGEKRRLGPQMFAKMRSSKSLSREDRVAFVKQLQADWAKLKAGAVPQGSEE